jgi:hypothetical protein
LPAMFLSSSMSKSVHGLLALRRPVMLDPPS